MEGEVSEVGQIVKVDDAECSDPLRKGCQWRGTLMLRAVPDGKTEELVGPESTCDPCPSCGGFAFQCRVLYRRLLGWERMDGETK